MAKKKSAMDLLLENKSRDFMDKYWLEKPLVHHGALKRIPSIFNDPMMQTPFTMLDEIKAKGDPVKVRVWFQNKNGKHEEVTVNSTAAAQLFNSGKVTLVVDDIGAACKSIKEIVTKMAAELGAPLKEAGCNVYASPKGEGSVAHFDTQDVFFLQLKGQKQWKIAANENVKYPTFSYFGVGVPAELAASCKTLPIQVPRKKETIILKPGSVLFLPRGTWHESYTIEDSFALTFSFATLPWFNLIAEVLRSRLIVKEKWRKPAVGIETMGSKKQAKEAEKYMAMLIEDLLKEVKEMI